MKKLFCKLLGHTWVHRSENPRIGWHTTKGMAELEMDTEATAPRFWLECQRCALRNEHPTREDLKNAI